MITSRVPAFLADLPSWDSDGDLVAVVEVPKGSRNKLDFDPEWGAFRLKKVLPAGMVFPYDFGFVPGTLADDGDPLDVLILLDDPVAPGTVVAARPVGVIEAKQRKDGGEWVRNDRLIAVAACSLTQAHVRDLSDLGDAFMDGLEAFFTDYHALDDRTFRPIARRGPATATRLVRKASTAHRR